MHKATQCGKEALAENVAYLGMVEDTGQMEGKRGGRSSAADEEMGEKTDQRLDTERCICSSVEPSL